MRIKKKKMDNTKQVLLVINGLLSVAKYIHPYIDYMIVMIILLLIIYFCRGNHTTHVKQRLTAEDNVIIKPLFIGSNGMHFMQVFFISF